MEVSAPVHHTKQHKLKTKRVLMLKETKIQTKRMVLLSMNDTWFSGMLGPVLVLKCMNRILEMDAYIVHFVRSENLFTLLSITTDCRVPPEAARECDLTSGIILSRQSAPSSRYKLGFTEMLKMKLSFRNGIPWLTVAYTNHTSQSSGIAFNLYSSCRT